MPLKNLKAVHPMEYQTTNPAELEVMRKVNEPIKNLYDLIDSSLPESADKTVSLRKLQEFKMQLNVTISHNGIN